MHREQHPVTHGIALRFTQGINNQDVGLIVGQYHEDARHFSPRRRALKPETGGWAHGIEEIRGHYEDALGRYKGKRLRYVLFPEKLITDPNHIHMTYTRLATGEPRAIVEEEFDVVGRLIKESRVLEKSS